jgi:hypothetical protein
MIWSVRKRGMISPSRETGFAVTSRHGILGKVIEEAIMGGAVQGDRSYAQETYGQAALGQEYAAPA